MLFGGNENPTSFCTFSTLTNQWKKVTNLLRERNLHGSVEMSNNVVYIVGGMDNKTIEKYDAGAKHFKTVNKMKTDRYFFGISPYKTDLFIVAGGYEDGVITDACFLYNTVSNTFKKIGKLNTERYGLFLVNCKDTVYAIGGCDKKDEFLETIEKFDPATENWSTIDAELNTARTLHRAVAHEEHIYVIGGMKENKKMISNIEKFNTCTGIIEIIKTKLEVARCNFAVCSDQSDVYIIGGYGQNKNSDLESFTRSVEIFNLESETLQKGKHIPFADQAFTACFCE